MITRLFVLLSTAFLLIGCQPNRPSVTPEEQDDQFFEFTVFGHTPVVTEEALASGNVKVNLKITNSSANVSVIDELVRKYPERSQEEIIQFLQHDLQPYFSLTNGKQVNIPCAMYHMEPPVVKEDGIRLVLWFARSNISSDITTTDISLAFNDPIFNQQKTTLSLGLAISQK